MHCIVLLVIAFTVACTPSAEVAERGRNEEGPNPELSAIDSLMWRQPDSALAVLQHFAGSPQADNLDKLNGHYCQLLISELLYKNDYGQSNRPALQQAVRYFDSLSLCIGVVRNVSTIAFLDARAHYINGAGYYERDSVVEACKEYLKALEVMEGRFEEKDLVKHKAQFLNYIYNRLGDLFEDQLLAEPAITCYNQALFYCRREPTSIYGIPVLLYRLGIQYNIIGQIDSAAFYYDDALANMPDFDNLHYRDLMVNKTLFDYYNLNYNSDSLIEGLKQLVELSADDEEKTTRLLTLGNILFEEKQYDSSRVYLETVFEQQEDITSKIMAAEYLCNIYQIEGDSIKAQKYASFLVGYTMSEIEKKIVASKVNEMFKDYLAQKQEKKSEIEREKSVKKVKSIIIPTAVVFALGILVFAKLKNRKLLKKHQEEAKRALEEAGRQHEQELIQQREEALAAERTHRIQQSALSNRLKRSNKELRELKDQIRQQTDSMNTKQETQALSFNDEPICRLIMERVNEGQFKSKMDYTSYKDYALGKDDLVALREAANRHFNQFTIRLAKAYSALTQGDLDYCCLYLLGLSDADVSALMQRAYTTINERNSKLRRVLGSENAISITLQAIANESISI